MLLWLIHTLTFMETVCICSTLSETALRLLQQSSCTTVRDSKMLTICLQRVRAVRETWTSETCFLCKRHKEQCGGGTEADD